MPTFMFFISMITCTVVANLLLKSGATMSVVTGESLIAFNWKILLGLGCFALGAFFYVLILRRVPLAIAQSFASVQYLAVILAATFVLGESIDARQWLGIVLIAAGVFLVGLKNA